MCDETCVTKNRVGTGALARPVLETFARDEVQETDTNKTLSFARILASQLQLPSLRHLILPPAMVLLLLNQTEPSFLINPTRSVQ